MNRPLLTAAAAIAVLVGAGTVESTTPASGAPIPKFEGSVISVKSSNRSFLMHDLRHGRNFRIYVRPRTNYRRGLKGYRSLRPDLEIEVRALWSPGGRLLARAIALD